MLAEPARYYGGGFSGRGIGTDEVKRVVKIFFALL